MEKETKQLLMGAAIGAAIGAGIAILISKQKEETFYIDETEEEDDLLIDDEEENHHHYLIWGGAAGALLAAVAGIFLFPKNHGIHFLDDTYEEVSSKTMDLIKNFNQKRQMIGEIVSEKAASWAENALAIADNLAEEVKEWSEMVIEAATLTGKELNPKSQIKLREIIEWSEKAKEIVEDVTYETKRWKDRIEEIANGDEDSFEEFTEEKRNISVKDIIEWTNIGVRLWKNFKALKS